MVVRILTFLESSMLNIHFVFHSWDFKKRLSPLSEDCNYFYVTLFQECNHIYSDIYTYALQTYTYIVTETYMDAYAYIYVYLCKGISMYENIY